MTFSELVAKIEAAFPPPVSITIEPAYRRFTYDDKTTRSELVWSACINREWTLDARTPEALWIRIRPSGPVDLSLMDAEKVVQS